MRNATVFGGSGFIGRYVVQRLAKGGHRVTVAVRNPAGAAFLQPLGNVGQITTLAANVTDEASVRRAVAGADLVINLVAVLFEKGRQRFADLHVQGAERVARAAREAGASDLVHVSALGASERASADYARSKAAGEAAVRAAFPDAVVMRPSLVIGPEDSFFNRFAGLAAILPALPLIDGGKTHFQPAYVGDVAEAIVRAGLDPHCRGKTFELGGPRIYTFKELLQLTLKEIQRRRLLLPLPGALASVPAALLQLLPKPPMTPDQIRMLQQDNVVSAGAPGFAQLGIEPTAIEAILPTYLDRYRVGGRFAKSA